MAVVVLVRAAWPGAAGLAAVALAAVALVAAGAAKASWRIAALALPVPVRPVLPLL